MAMSARASRWVIPAWVKSARVMAARSVSRPGAMRTKPRAQSGRAWLATHRRTSPSCSARRWCRPHRASRRALPGFSSGSSRVDNRGADRGADRSDAEPVRERVRPGLRRHRPDKPVDRYGRRAQSTRRRGRHLGRVRDPVARCGLATRCAVGDPPVATAVPPRTSEAGKQLTGRVVGPTVGDHPERGAVSRPGSSGRWWPGDLVAVPQRGLTGADPPRGSSEKCRCTQPRGGTASAAAAAARRRRHRAQSGRSAQLGEEPGPTVVPVSTGTSASSATRRPRNR